MPPTEQRTFWREPLGLEINSTSMLSAVLQSNLKVFLLQYNHTLYWHLRIKAPQFTRPTAISFWLIRLSECHCMTRNLLIMLITMRLNASFRFKLNTDSCGLSAEHGDFFIVMMIFRSMLFSISTGRKHGQETENHHEQNQRSITPAL